MEKRKKLFFGGVGAKAIAIFASVSLCVGLIGCGKEPVETVDPNAEQSTAQQSEQVVEKIEGEDAPLGSIDVEGPNQTQEESGEVVQEIVPLFEGAVGEAYETDSVDWLVNGNDDDVITLVYTCVDNTHGGWGVVGTGATVDGAWVEGPSFKADEKNPLALLYTSFTVKQLKSMLGVEEDSVVSFFKVSSWNGGQIVALYVTSAGEVLELNNATEVELEGTASGEEEEEVAAFEFEGNYDRFLTTVSNLEIKIADYISGYVPGTPIIVEMKMESDGLFNGCLGTCIGSDYAWTTKEFASDTGSEVTLSWELVPSIDNIQLQLWAMEGSKVGVRSIKMSQTTISENTIVGNTDSNKPSMNGSYLAKYTSGGDVSYNISLLSSGWTMGDTVRVTVVYECDGGTNGAFGTCVGSNYAWTTSNWSTDNYGTYTASFEVTPSIDNVQFQIYYVGGSAIGIKSVSVAVTASPYSGIAIMSTGSKHVASIASLCPGVEDGDTVRLSATLYSGDYFNGCIGGSNSNEAWINTSGECSNGESTWSVTISNVDADAAAEVQVWWSNSGKVALKSLTGTIVAKGEKTEEGEDGEEGEEGEGGEEGGE